MSNRSESRSTILPLPSSPHWAPMTAITIGLSSEIRGQRSGVDTQEARLRSNNTETAPGFFVRSGYCSRADMLVEHARDCLLGGCPDYALFLSPILKENQSRYPFDSVAL